MAETCLSRPEGFQWTDGVALNFRLLALETSPCLASDVDIHAWPQVLCSDEVLSRINNRVRQGMHNDEGGAAKVGRNVEARTICRHVTNQGSIAVGIVRTEVGGNYASVVRPEIRCPLTVL